MNELLFELANALKDRFLQNGEISGNDQVAEWIVDFEKDYGTRFSMMEVTVAKEQAAEDFVDSMIRDIKENVDFSDWDKPVTANRIAEYEAMRPSSTRKAAIKVALDTFKI